MTKIAIITVLPLFLMIGCAEQINTQVTRYQFDDLRDADGDGVINQRDACANTPDKAAVDSQGCAHWYQNPDVDLVSFFFEMDKYAIKPEHERPLTEVVTLLKENPDSKVILVGDTSPEASLNYNIALAKRRTREVRQRLVEKGVDPARIEEQEFSQHTSLTNQLQARKRRAIAVIEVQTKGTKPRWTIFSSDTSLTSNSKVEVNDGN
ncbi:OmpA family protein [Vibrio mytili]|uniref:OmpA family protein n=1 Tax=Vibrio mytili TaxID=50718 RepID=UPI002F419287